MRPDQKQTLATRLDATRTHLANLAEEHAHDADRALEMAVRRLRGKPTLT